MNNEHNIMTLEEVAKYLRCHPSTVYRLLKRHELPAFKLGRDYRFNRDAIDHWTEQESAKEQHRERN